MEKRETTPSERLAINPTENQLAVHDMTEGASYAVKPIEEIDNTLPQPSSPKRRLGDKRLAVALAGSMLISGATGAFAQEDQPKESMSPSPAPTEPASADGELTPISADSEEESGVQEDVVSLEAEETEPISFYKSLKDALKSQDPENSNESNNQDVSEDLDFKTVRGNIVDWYIAHPEELDNFTLFYGAEPKDYLNLVNKELSKKEINKRDQSAAYTMFVGLISSLANSKDHDLLSDTKDYISLTLNEFKNKYRNGNKQIVEDFSDSLKEIFVEQNENVAITSDQEYPDATEEEIAVPVDEVDETTTQYSPDTLFEKKLKNLNKNGIKKIINNNSKATTKYVKEEFNPKYTVAEEKEYFNSLFKRFTSDTNYESNGEIIAMQVVNMIEDANKMHKKGYKKAAKAYMNIAHAFYRRGYTILRDNGKRIEKNDFNKLIENAFGAKDKN